VNDCRKCCVIGIPSGDTRIFDEVELNVDPMMFERLPEVQQFVNKVAPKHDEISVNVRLCFSVLGCFAVPEQRHVRWNWLRGLYSTRQAGHPF
jgi:hypothetical protein